MVEGWKKVMLKDIAKDEKNSFIDGDWIELEHIKDSGIRIIQTGNIGIGKCLDKPESKKFISIESFKLLNCKKVFTDDILICRLAEPIGRACIVPNIENYYVTSVDVVIFRENNKRYDKKFILYVLNYESTLKKAEELAAGSTRQRVSRTNLGNLELEVPEDIREQRKIAESFETFDNAIEKTHKIIAKYKRIKQGLMQDLLTKGIDENGQIRSEETHKFKDSPLGRIPEEWEVVRLGEIAEITSSKRIYFDEYTEEGIPFYRSKEIIEKAQGLNIEKTLFIPENKYRFIEKHFGTPKTGDILITAVGTLGVIYVIKTSDGKFYFKDGNLLWLKNLTGSLIDIELLAYLFQEVFEKQKEILTIGTSQNALTIEKMKEMQIPLSPLPEQQRIASILSQIDETIEKEQKYKEKLERIKQGLMEDLLTGKVRVNHLIEEGVKNVPQAG